MGVIVSLNISVIDAKEESSQSITCVTAHVEVLFKGNVLLES
jgi:hypothetical protein